MLFFLLLQGHGEYSEVAEEKDFFDITRKSKNVVCHFYRDDFFRCKVVDKHLALLARKHLETKFCKINAEKCPFLTGESAACTHVNSSIYNTLNKDKETKITDILHYPQKPERLRIKTLPTIALVKDAKTKDYIVGFTDLGSTDEFTTETMEWRIAQADVIEYSGDLLVPPSQRSKKIDIRKKKTIRDDESDSD